MHNPDMPDDKRRNLHVKVDADSVGFSGESLFLFLVITGGCARCHQPRVGGVDAKPMQHMPAPQHHNITQMLIT